MAAKAMHGNGLRIFTYHSIDYPPVGTPLPKLHVSPEMFDRQCRWLTRLGMRGVSMSEGYRALREGNAGKLVAITLDDGYQDNVLHAAPILSRYGFSATCYVVSNTIGGDNAWDAALGVPRAMMTADELHAWQQQGFEIGSHTCTHPHLDRLDPATLAAEMRESRQRLQTLTGAAVEHFCYPYGDHNAAVVEAARQAGYVTATTTRKGIAQTSDDPLQLPRISINGGRGIAKFVLYAGTAYAEMRR